MPADPPNPARHEIRIHADSLEYTRTGLKTRSSIPLVTGKHNRVVIVRPVPQAVVGDGRGGFAHESVFPLPATLSVFWHFAHRLSVFAHLPSPPELDTSGIFRIYAHSSASGDEAYNKGLTDRRAAVGLCLLTGDVEGFAAEAVAWGWGLTHHQALLRMLGCDPGPVDDQPGDLTTQAIAMFQRRYHKGDFHRHTECEPRNSAPFESPGELDAATVDALLEAFVVAHAAHVPPANIHPTHPAAGCSELNPIVDDLPWAHRRLSLIRHDALPPHHDAAPCMAGDAPWFTAVETGSASLRLVAKRMAKTASRLAPRLGRGARASVRERGQARGLTPRDTFTNSDAEFINAVYGSASEARDRECVASSNAGEHHTARGSRLPPTPRHTQGRP